jgi:hypothetical protein
VRANLFDRPFFYCEGISEGLASNFVTIVGLLFFEHPLGKSPMQAITKDRTKPLHERKCFSSARNIDYSENAHLNLERSKRHAAILPRLPLLVERPYKALSC